MKVCLLNDSFPPVIDGVANAVLNYAENLNEMNDTDVIVGTPFYPEGNYDTYPFRVIPYDSLDTSFLTGGYRAGMPFPVRQISEMASFQPDIIHTHCPISSCFVARSLRDITDAPVVLTYHTKYDIDIRNTVPTRLAQDESIRALVNNVSACDEVWTVSAGAGENLRSLGYEGEYKIVVNGVDFPKGRVPDEIVRETVKEYDLPSDLPVFLFTGRLMKYKGLPMLVDALRMLAEKEDFRMVMIGQGNDSGELKQMIRDKGLRYDETDENGIISSHEGVEKGKIIFTGPVWDRAALRAWNCRADLFVFPSVFDTNGLVVREAAACSLASVLIRGSCAAEGITDGRNGYLIEESADALAEMLEYACRHRSELKQTGEHASDEIYLSWQDAVAYARKLYGELLEKKECGCLTGKKRMADDPLFEMTAEAAMKYAQISETDFPYLEGMLDNLAEFHQKRREKIVSELKESRKELERYLRLLR
ncbi:MAG: glycosyltransferase family 4 protein [Erysipelotrichaceae bacterium]|nr:glycosyltransferase family 4 protein [Erysipelotrichaceae bacterium]